MKPERHGKVADLEGRKFGRLTVTEFAGTDQDYKLKTNKCEMVSSSNWKCVCDCGEIVFRTSKQLRLRSGLWCEECKKKYSKVGSVSILELGIKFNKGIEQ
jgi:hypothetical protein